jgi:hypothetical protein
MNILEKYSANCGVKIVRPTPASSYFPLREESYIILDLRNKYLTNIYELFSDVLSYIDSSLKSADIKIYVFNSHERDIIAGTQPFINLTKKQEAYLIKNSLLVVSADNLSSYYASALGVPSVGLYSAYPADCTAPLWSNLHSSLSSDHCGNLPSYGMEETPKTINFIKPEKLAALILEKLSIDFPIDVETIYMGDHYPVKVVEVIPDYVPPADFLQGRAINLRADYHFHEERIIHWLQGRMVNLLIEEPINLNLLKYFKQNVVQLTVNINDSFSEEYLKSVVATGIKLEIFCEDKEKITDFRFKLFDFDIEASIFKSKKDLDESLNKFSKNTYFLSGKILLSEGEKYSCLEAKKQKNVLTGEPEIVYDTKDFWKELDHYRLFNKI